jgi:hypothetical protein
MGRDSYFVDCRLRERCGCRAVHGGDVESERPARRALEVWHQRVRRRLPAFARGCRFQAGVVHTVGVDVERRAADVEVQSKNIARSGRCPLKKDVRDVRGKHGLRRGVDESWPRPRSLRRGAEHADDVGRHRSHHDHFISQGCRRGAVANHDEAGIPTRRGYGTAACTRAPARPHARASRPGGATRRRATAGSGARTGLRAGPTSDIAGAAAALPAIGAARGREQDDNRDREKCGVGGHGVRP